MAGLGESKLSALTTPAGTFTYAYDAHDNLISVTGPDATTRTYLYEDPSDVHNLTGIVDASGTQVNAWSYNANDQVTTASLADGLDEITVAYPASLRSRKKIIVSVIVVVKLYNSILRESHSV